MDKILVRTLLDAKTEELVEELAGLRERLKLDATLSPEDRLARSLEAAEAAERIEGVKKRLKALSAVRERESAGTLGTCEGCGGEIPPARLLATAFLALRCIRCQEWKEKQETVLKDSKFAKAKGLGENDPWEPDASRISYHGRSRPKWK